MKYEIISKQPRIKKFATPLIFIHGAWHAAWCWDAHFLDYFSKRGFLTYAFSLRGHGKSEGREKLRWARISEYVSDLTSIVSTISNPPILIGHSMGGLVAQKYLEKHSAVAAVLLASVPPAGVLATTIRIALRHPIEFMKVNLTLSLYPLISTPDLAQEAFFSSNIAREKVERYCKFLQDESYLGFLDMLIMDLPRPEKVRTPMLVLGAEKDKLFYKNEIEATARAYKTNAEIIPNIAHDMMLEDGWEKVADRILVFIREYAI